MRKGLLAAVVAIIAIPGVAAAEGSYFSFGAGPSEVNDHLAAHTGDGGRVRIAIGHRLGNWAFEGFVAPEFFDQGVTSGVGVGIDARYILPISSGLQAYVRGSASRLSVGLDEGCAYNAACADGGYYDSYQTHDYSGRGLGGGIGVQLRGKVRALGFLYWPLFFVPAGPKVNAAIFIDHGYDFYRLHPEDGVGGSIDAKITRLTIGFNVGKDF